MADTPTNETASVSSVTSAEPAAAAVAEVAVAAAPAPVASARPAAATKVSLEYFATQLSARDKRVALIHGWVHTEKAAKRFRDLPANYQARYVAFENQPV